MKISQITPQAPSLNSGGGIGVAQTALSLFENGYEVDYVGPPIEDASLAGVYRKHFILDATTSKLIRFIDLLHGVTYRRYRAWKNLKIDFGQYDFFVMDFTKLDYVLKRINPDKLIVRVHNVESEFVCVEYSKGFSAEGEILKKLTPIREKKLVHAARELVFLTSKDRSRMQELYGSARHSTVVPVCVTEKQCEKSKKADGTVSLLYTGSLNFSANIQGILWFINKVCPKLKVNYRLTVAGYHPTEELLRVPSENPKVQIVDTPETMTPYFENADLVIAPVFDGAGMKVKVAEALSFGKPVLGTNHAYIGYKISDRNNSFVANSVEEFAEQINYFGSLSFEQREEIKDEAYELFKSHYSISTSASLWADILEKDRTR